MELPPIASRELMLTDTMSDQHNWYGRTINSTFPLTPCPVWRVQAVFQSRQPRHMQRMNRFLWMNKAFVVRENIFPLRIEMRGDLPFHWLDCWHKASTAGPWVGASRPAPSLLQILRVQLFLEDGVCRVAWWQKCSRHKGCEHAVLQ